MERRLGNLAVIGEIGGGSEAEAVNLSLAMNQPHRLEVRPEKLHGTVDRAQLELRQAAILVIGVEDVAEHLAQKSGCIGTRVERQLPGLVRVAERAQIVDAQDVVSVRVRVKNCIQARDLLADS